MPRSSPAVKRVFAELTERQLRRLAVTSVAELEAAILAYIDRRNAAPPPGGKRSHRPWTSLTHAPGGIRTHDPQLRRLQLYPTELPAPTDEI